MEEMNTDPRILCDAKNNVVALLLQDTTVRIPIPDYISKLTMLNNLYINPATPTIGSLPDVLWNMTNLAQLTLTNTHLHGTISKDISRLTKLNLLNLGANLLSGELPSLSSLTSLLNLDIGNRKIVPFETRKLPTSLETLDISSIDFSQGFPIGLIKQLPKLRNLFANRVRLTYLPPGDISKLEKLSLASNLISGELSYFLPATSLTYLDMTGNQLSGPIPAEFGGLKKLKHLSLGGNLRITGTMPPSLASLKDMIFLNISKTAILTKWPGGAFMNKADCAGLGVDRDQICCSDARELAICGVKLSSVCNTESQCPGSPMFSDSTKYKFISTILILGGLTAAVIIIVIGFSIINFIKTSGDSSRGPNGSVDGRGRYDAIEDEDDDDESEGRARLVHTV